MLKEAFKILGIIAVDNAEANRTIDETVKKSKKIGEGFKKSKDNVKKSFSEIAAESGKTINELRSDIMKLAREYEKQGMSRSEAMKKAYDEFGVKAKKTHKKVNEEAENSKKRITSAFKKIGAAVVTYLTIDKIKDFGQACVDMSAEVAAEQSAFEQIMGDYSDAAQGKVNEIADATGMVSTRLTPYMTSMTAKFKGLGFDIGDATDYAKQGLNIAADAAAFWDKSLDDSMSALNSFVNGSYEGGEAIGLFANDTQMAAYAVKEGIVSESKEWANLDEKIKQATRLEYAENMQKASGAVGQAAKESNQYANVQSNLTEKWRQFKAQVGEPILQNIVLPVMKKLGDFITGKLQPGFEKLKEKVVKLKDKLSDAGSYIYATFSPALDSIRNLFSKVKDALQPLIDKVKNYFKSGEAAADATSLFKGAIELASDAVKIISDKVSDFVGWLEKGSVGAEIFKGVVVGLTAAIAAYKVAVLLATAAEKAKTLASKASIAAQKLLNLVMSVNPIFLIISAITALVAAFIYFWNHCESFREFWKNLWEDIKERVRLAVEVIKAIWEAIKQFFIDLCISIAERNQAIVDKVKSVWTAVKDFFKGIWDSIKQWFIDLCISIAERNQKIADKIKSVWDSIKDFFKGIWDSIKQWFIDLCVSMAERNQEATDKIKSVWKNVKSFFSDIWNKIKGVFGNVKDWFREKFSGAWDAVKNVFSGVGDFFGGIWNTIKSKFSDIGEKVGSTISGAVKGAINSVIATAERTINSAIGLINNAIELINKIPYVEVGSVSTVSFPRLARGGIVDRSTIANIGEDGAEAIVPLENNTQWIDKVAEKIAEKGSAGNSDVLLSKLNELIEAIKSLKIYLDGDALVGEIAPAMDARLGSINRIKRRGG